MNRISRTLLFLSFCLFCGSILQPLVRADGDRETAPREFLSGITQPTRLVEEAAYPSWSPDGLRIAYSSMPGGPNGINGGGIMIRTLGERESRRLTADGKDPRWSPDGEWIAYSRAGYHRTLESIWVIPAKRNRLPQFIAEGGYPQWMPDSRTLVYHSRQTHAVCRATIEDGTPIRKERLFDLPYWYPRLSPDGKEIAYLLPSLGTFLNGKDASKRDYILIVSDLKKRLKRYRMVSFSSFLGDWSPQGDRLVWGGVRPRNPGLQVISAGLQSSPQVILEGRGSHPAWSPDGLYLAYDELKEGRFELWIMQGIH